MDGIVEGGRHPDLQHTGVRGKVEAEGVVCAGEGRQGDYGAISREVEVEWWGVLENCEKGGGRKVVLKLGKRENVGIGRCGSLEHWRGWVVTQHAREVEGELEMSAA